MTFVLIGAVIVVALAAAFVLRLRPERRLAPRLWDGAQALVGAALVALGVAGMFADGELIVLVLLGLGLLSGPVGFHLPGTNGPLPRVSRRGFAVTIDGFPAGVRTARIGLGVLAATLVLYLATLDVGRGANAACFVLFLVVFGVLVRSAGGLHRLAIDREGLWWQAGGAQRLIPWEAMTDAGAVTSAIPLDAFAIDRDQLNAALTSYAREPGERTPGALIDILSPST